jgi:hypothetical protein
VVTFGFHPALKVTKITDDSGKLLEGERTADGSIRVTAGTPFVDGQPAHWTFVYDGVITGNEDGPVEGLKLAAIQEPISYLLYPARWFPTTGFMTDRFTAELHIRVPQGMRVFASGSTGASKPVTLSSGKPGDEYDFNWSKPGFPGTVIAGRYLPPVSAGPGNVKVYVTITHQASANAARANRHQRIQLLHRHFRPSSHAPHQHRRAARRHLARRLRARAGRHHGLSHRRQIRHPPPRQHHRPPVVGTRNQPQNPRRCLDHQRHVALRRAHVRRGSERPKRPPKAAMEDVSAGALAYDTTPLSSVGRLDPFSPQFQSMTLEKGAMIFHMLRWEVGDKVFPEILKAALSQYSPRLHPHRRL